MRRYTGCKGDWSSSVRCPLEDEKEDNGDASRSEPYEPIEVSDDGYDIERASEVRLE